MKMRYLGIAVSAASVLSMVPAVHAAPTLAITEFMVDPWGTDLEQEWVELFNYGTEDLNLQGYTLKDNASKKYTFPSYTIPSGGYVIVAQNSTAFTDRWLGGVVDSRVLGTASGYVSGSTTDYTDGVFQLNNSSDGLYLRDNTDALIWSVGYDGNYTAYKALFLAVDDFSITDYGLPPQNEGPARINYNGLDNTTPATLGYEGNNYTADPYARSSSASSSEVGSPLAGPYTVVPEPATMALALPAIAILARRRR